jgi:hypothetical protein
MQQQAGLLDPGELLHQALFRRSSLEHAEVWPIGPSLAHKNVLTPGRILRGTELAEGVPGLNL